MVDIRQDVCAVIVGGTPAPGINGVISAIVIKCTSMDIVPIGFLYGFEYLRQGITKYYQTLRIEDVTRVHNRGGSILYTSKEQLRTPDEIENCIRALQHLRVKYLITIGGTETAFSAHKLAIGFRDRSLLLNTPSVVNTATNNNGTRFKFMNMNLNTPAAQPPTSNLSSGADNNWNGILITHVPKTIFNDLPLPDNCYTFGFSTAREIGCKIVADLSADAKSMNRWYIVTIIGVHSGHLTLGISTAAAATICLIPEEFEHQKITKSKRDAEDKTRREIQDTVKSFMEQVNRKTEFMEQVQIPKEIMESLLDKNDDENHVQQKRKNDAQDEHEEKKETVMNGYAKHKQERYALDTGADFKEYVDILDACMIKRAAEGKFYGVAVVGEGCVDLLKQRDLDKFFNGRKDRGHELFALTLKGELAKRWEKRKYSMSIRTKFVGFELRSADPNAHDMILSRELGFSAVLVCQMKQVNATIVTMKGGELVSIPLSEIVDPETNKSTIKKVDTKSLAYKVSQTYMLRLNRSDLANKKATKKYADMAGMDVNTFVKTYSYIASSH
eukprot:CAMPEP_0197024190 /NCGR_PEP_ID=MMETSP1384-20130603/4809_1 /TAXON_ID=29189 /ORGANISM="Ammonia sp." /LENGTH=556 /DNA_ID=CAMNT_0042452535 /DNA_START=73 /DNA_END=1743 /DNA_ORIENTATION=+